VTALTLFTPAGVLVQAAPLRLAARRLKAQGYTVHVDPAATARHQRFGGTDDVRLQAIHRVAHDAPSIAMATRGGYGLTRLLERLDWKLLARSVERGTRWVGYSDMSTLQLALLAHTGAPSWSGPLAVDDYGREELDDVTVACFDEAMSGELEAVGFRTEAGFDGLQARGRLWGGNLTMTCALIGTAHWPRVKGGILFLEDVNDHPYRVERNLLHLWQAGVIDAQKAVVLGQFSAWKPAAHDRGYTLKSAVAALRARTRTPILTGLPYGHVATHVTLPQGRRAQLLVDGRQALIGW
jgi:muramoyltetrapeptide carboxypeptidase